MLVYPNGQSMAQRDIIKARRHRRFRFYLLIDSGNGTVERLPLTRVRAERAIRMMRHFRSVEKSERAKR